MIFKYLGEDDTMLDLQHGVSYDLQIHIQAAYFKTGMHTARMGLLACKKGAGKGKPYSSVEKLLEEWDPVR